MAEPEDAYEPIRFSVDDALEILERRRWWIVTGALVGLALGFVAYLVLPARYASTTTILVEPQEVPESYIKSTVTLEISQRLGTLSERVTSHQSLNELIDHVGAERMDPTGQVPRESIMDRVRSNLDVQTGDGGRGSSANVVVISYTDADPVLAADVAREIAGMFISENLKDRTRQATATAEFLDRELERLRHQVTEQEERIRDFRFDHMGALPSQLDANLRSLDRLNLELASNLEAQEAVTQRTALLRRQAAGTGGDADAQPTTLNEALIKARRELLQTQRVYTDEHPNVIRLREEIAHLERQIEDQADRFERGEVGVLDPNLSALRPELDAAAMDLASRRREEARIRERIDELQNRVDKTARMEEEELALTRDYGDLMETYRTLLKKKYDAALARNLEQAQKGERFKLLRPARVPTSPSWPDLRLLLPGGLVLGLGFAGFLVALAEFRNPAFRSVERLTRVLGLPVFASIPRIDNDRIYEEAPKGDVDPKLVVYTAPESAPAEQYRGFLPTILEAENCRVILVTSAARGDGKTLTCMNLAVMLASDLNRRVLVIDGDLRRPAVHRVVRVPRRRGLSNILMHKAGLEECAINSKIPNLTVLPAGPTVRNPLALISDQTFLDVLREARERYDLVLVDSPPLLPVVDTRVLRRLADMVLFVVRADATPRAAVVRSLNDIRDVAGVVFNEVSAGSFRRYYYHDAYSRYAYGDPASDEGPEDGERDA